MYARKISASLVLVFTLVGFYVTSNRYPVTAQVRPIGSLGITTATIISSGSTNKDSYTIVLARTGDAEFTREPGDKTEMTGVSTVKSKIATELANKFFIDLEAAMPVSNLPTEGCSKNDSLGSATYVTVSGQKSPDLGCSRDPRKSSLYDDITLITSTFASKDAAPELPGDNPPIRSITLTDDNKTVHLKVGETFALRLGTTYTWAMAGLDQSIVDQHADPKGPSGTQGVFKAAAVGKSDLRAIGDPHCATPKGTCGATRNFKVTLIVDQQ